MSSAASIVFAGVDEAGLGPVLGPLTLGFSVFRAPPKAANLWRALEPLVSADPLHDKECFVVADSKVVFQRTPRSAQRLETTALGFLALLEPARKPPACSRRLAWEMPRELGPSPDALARHPWYGGLGGGLPRHVDAAWLEIRADMLARRMRARAVELLDAGVCTLPEGELNRSFQETENKALTHWHKSAALLRLLWERHAHHDLRLTVDRHGGRVHYGPLLARAFPDASVACVRERASLSEYTLTERDPPLERPPRRTRILFAERGERRSFAVALASCLAKYARETCMQAFNAYFLALEPGLRPTAGYNTDGRRWLAEAAPMLDRAGVERALLMRER